MLLDSKEVLMYVFWLHPNRVTILGQQQKSGSESILWGLCLLVVSTHLKNISQIGSFPQVRVKIKYIETTSQLMILNHAKKIITGRLAVQHNIHKRATSQRLRQNYRKQRRENNDKQTNTYNSKNRTRKYTVYLGTFPHPVVVGSTDF